MNAISVVIPCLNEAATIGNCIRRARQALAQSEFDFSEIIVADNGSIDDSVNICRAENVKVVEASQKGYGSALHAGIMAASTPWIVFADGDESYDFGQLSLFIPPLEQGYDLVVGNRFGGTIAKGAMPFLHRYLGTPVISYIGRKSFHVTLTDFNSGMRAITRKAYLQLDMQAAGMEYASEMIAKAALNRLKITEVPIDLHKDQRNRKPHLRTWQDGWKHLKLILVFSPKWLLLFPAVFFLFTGCLLGGILVFSYIKIFNLVLDIHTLYFASIFLTLGFQLLQFYLLARLYGKRIGLYPDNKLTVFIRRRFTFEKSLLVGSVVFLAGIFLSAYAVFQWQENSFGALNPVSVFRIIIPGGFGITLGMQIIVFGFLLYIIKSIKNIH
ncbi:glycosyltransferase family 2 protein [Flavihumibacter petaseus]|uniref:Putative glycosyltransferase n=1 Tax=Flavihumibacter petaseus NBRC 106054 TaxID=1220578 RepID=A0A0E9N1G2_9BACT|nr:glycosyltransferase family 2 protein [Flavihumibacter petaseus]GAO43613.1 putative glycosyltransferase [Flavihumibacter petaseus NBRC 106054]